MERIIFHIDVNSAFLSWSALEQLKKDPQSVDLRDIPSIVGGDQKSRHGVVLAKSVPAKQYHIQTGEPIAQALKKYPNLVIASPDHASYEHYSRLLKEILYSYTSDIEPLSIDECFLDFTPIANRFSSFYEGAKTMQNHIFQSLGFTVNIGISSNRLLAKMASDFTKPNRIHTLFPEEIPTKMWPLPVSDLYMVGRSSAATLHKLGILTIGDLAHTNKNLLFSHLKSHGNLIWEYANGIDSDILQSTPSALKGIGNSTTLADDIVTIEETEKVLLRLSETVAERLRASKQLAQMVSVEIRYSDFINVSHQKKLASPANTTRAIYEVSCQLFSECWNHAPVRLLGIRTSKLVSESDPIQLSLFDAGNNQKQKKVEEAMDSIRNRFGEHSVIRATNLRKELK